ncbi:hypothetical protein ADUPG1_012569 [Aduncisulcus paluster]|uniref:Uncharacterized protein n=1 Tax=Aduncisulcus paluster TaxID=2918883 RepID=A0ABQ5K1Q7_9EUKA|nr:hypothetical protein ADUPG1_012569 [Aduncisulcus paluster]
MDIFSVEVTTAPGEVKELKADVEELKQNIIKWKRDLTKLLTDVIEKEKVHLSLKRELREEQLKDKMLSILTKCEQRIEKVEDASEILKQRSKKKVGDEKSIHFSFNSVFNNTRAIQDDLAPLLSNTRAQSLFKRTERVIDEIFLSSTSNTNMILEHERRQGLMVGKLFVLYVGEYLLNQAFHIDISPSEKLCCFPSTHHHSSVSSKSSSSSSHTRITALSPLSKSRSSESSTSPVSSSVSSSNVKLCCFPSTHHHSSVSSKSSSSSSHTRITALSPLSKSRSSESSTSPVSSSVSSSNVVSYAASKSSSSASSSSTGISTMGDELGSRVSSLGITSLSVIRQFISSSAGARFSDSLSFSRTTDTLCALLRRCKSDRISQLVQDGVSGVSQPPLSSLASSGPLSLSYLTRGCIDGVISVCGYMLCEAEAEEGRDEMRKALFTHGVEEWVDSQIEMLCSNLCMCSLEPSMMACIYDESSDTYRDVMTAASELVSGLSGAGGGGMMDGSSLGAQYGDSSFHRRSLSSSPSRLGVGHLAYKPYIHPHYLSRFGLEPLAKSVFQVCVDVISEHQSLDALSSVIHKIVKESYLHVRDIIPLSSSSSPMVGGIIRRQREQLMTGAGNSVGGISSLPRNFAYYPLVSTKESTACITTVDAIMNITNSLILLLTSGVIADSKDCVQSIFITLSHISNSVASKIFTRFDNLLISEPMKLEMRQGSTGTSASSYEHFVDEYGSTTVPAPNPSSSSSSSLFVPPQAIFSLVFPRDMFSSCLLSSIAHSFPSAKVYTEMVDSVVRLCDRKESMGEYFKQFTRSLDGSMHSQGSRSPSQTRQDHTHHQTASATTGGDYTSGGSGSSFSPPGSGSKQGEKPGFHNDGCIALPPSHFPPEFVAHLITHIIVNWSLCCSTLIRVCFLSETSFIQTITLGACEFIKHSFESMIDLSLDHRNLRERCVLLALLCVVSSKSDVIISSMTEIVNLAVEEGRKKRRLVGLAQSDWNGNTEYSMSTSTADDEKTQEEMGTTGGVACDDDGGDSMIGRDRDQQGGRYHVKHSHSSITDTSSSSVDLSPVREVMVDILRETCSRLLDNLCLSMQFLFTTPQPTLDPLSGFSLTRTNIDDSIDIIKIVNVSELDSLANKSPYLLETFSPEPTIVPMLIATFVESWICVLCISAPCLGGVVAKRFIHRLSSFGVTSLLLTSLLCALVQNFNGTKQVKTLTPIGALSLLMDVAMIDNRMEALGHAVKELYMQNIEKASHYHGTTSTLRGKEHTGAGDRVDIGTSSNISAAVGLGGSVGVVSPVKVFKEEEDPLLAVLGSEGASSNIIQMTKKLATMIQSGRWDDALSMDFVSIHLLVELLESIRLPRAQQKECQEVCKKLSSLACKIPPTNTFCDNKGETYFRSPLSGSDLRLVDLKDTPRTPVDGKIIGKAVNISSTGIFQIVEPQFIHEGDEGYCPIPRDAPNIKSPKFPIIKAIDKTKNEGEYGYDQSSKAQRMMKGEWNLRQITQISIPFSFSSPMKGVYICLSSYSPPSHLIFTLTSPKGEKTSKTYEFPEFRDDSWYFLPVDLPDILLCEITGKGRDEEWFGIESLVFISREETPEEIKAREFKEKLWSEAPVLKPEFVKEGDKESKGRDSIPIPRDDPKLVDPSFSMVKCKNDVFSKESKLYDQSLKAQRMLKGERGIRLSHLSIPFLSPSPMKGAYICVDNWDSSPSLLFTFIGCDGKKTFKKYEFTKPEHKLTYEWHFLSIDLDNVVLCEIEGKGTWEEKNSRDFWMNSLFFVRVKYFAPVEPQFIHEGNSSCCPIPRDAPNIKSAELPLIIAIDKTEEEGEYGYDQSSNAQQMMKGGCNNGDFTHISIPFSSSSPMKGAYICLDGDSSPPSYLIFTLISSKGEKTSRKYEFPEFEHNRWYFLPVDLPDVLLCEITGKGRDEEYFRIESLVFIREETPEEILVREAREKLWSEAPVLKPEFVKGVSHLLYDRKSFGRDSILIPDDDLDRIHPSFPMIKCKDDSYSKESDYYDKSSRAQKMLKGEDNLWLSHLSIPFPSPSPMKGAYICVREDHSSPSLLFTFTDSDGKKTFKKYEFTKPEHKYEWHFLPIDLNNVVLCEIEGKEGRWNEKNSRYFWMDSLFFVRVKDFAPVEPLFIHEGYFDCCPIPRDAPNIKSAELPLIIAIDKTEEEGEYGYDQSSNAQQMMKGGCNNGDFTHISIPFSSSSPMKGAYICLYGNSSSPSHLIFTLTSSKWKKISKKYEFPEFEGKHYHWYFLPVDLPDVLLCEITGKGRDEEPLEECFNIRGRCKQYFGIESLVFIREETPEEIIFREFKEKLCSEAPVVKAEFVKEGDKESKGRDFIPIARDDPKLVDPSFSMVKCKNDSVSKESEYYDQSLKAQRMLKGEGSVRLSHLSIPFPSPSPMKGAYICVDNWDSSPSLLFTFIGCDGKKTFKKYEFTKPKHYFEWHFLPIDLNNVVLCEIEGKEGRWEEKNSRYFWMDSLFFVQVKDFAPVEPQFIHEGNSSCCPIPRDAPNIKSAELPSIKAIDGIEDEGEYRYDQSSNAQQMMREKRNFGHFTHISIPFSSSSPMKGAYICLYDDYSSDSPPSHLIFALTSSKGEKTSKKYKFPEFEGGNWYFLPIDLPDVVLCEITGKGRETDFFGIVSLVFISREETPEEILVRETKEKLWSEAPVLKPEFVKEGGIDSIPISCDNPILIDPSFSMVKCKDDLYCRESKEYDRSSKAQKMLKGKDVVRLSHLSIPFTSPCPMEGAYICVHKRNSSPQLLFTFTDCDGKKTFKKYEFTRPKDKYEWHFLPIDLDNVVLCEIEGKGKWDDKNSRDFWIPSLIFTVPEETVVSELLSLLPWGYSKDDIKTRCLTSHGIIEEAMEEYSEEEEDSYQHSSDQYSSGDSSDSYGQYSFEYPQSWDQYSFEDCSDSYGQSQREEQ